MTSFACCIWAQLIIFFCFIFPGVAIHYENKPVQYIAIFHGCKKNDNFQLKFFDYFHIFAQNID